MMYATLSLEAACACGGRSIVRGARVCSVVAIVALPSRFSILMEP